MSSTIFYININRLRALGVSENSPTPQLSTTNREIILKKEENGVDDPAKIL
jgi:hypothetical protein